MGDRSLDSAAAALLLYPSRELDGQALSETFMSVIPSLSARFEHVNVLADSEGSLPLLPSFSSSTV